MGKGMLIIISGPSGSGKGTVVKRLCPPANFKRDINDTVNENFINADLQFAVSISVTTRKMRDGEVNGRDYFFCSEEEFYTRLKNGDLLESATFCGNYYGTPRSYVEEQIEKGKTVVLEIEVNGALQVKEKLKDSVLIFLMPPSMQDLKNRLINRNTENMETIEDRLRRAYEEIALIDKYDYLVINKEIADAVRDIKTIVKAEKLRTYRNTLETIDCMPDNKLEN